MNSKFVPTNYQPQSAPFRTPTVQSGARREAGVLLPLSLALWILAWSGCARAQSEPTRVPGRATSARAVSTTTDKRSRDKLFRSYCARCHDGDGTGGSTRATVSQIPDFSSRGWQASRSDAQLLASIMDGKGTRMPTFRGKVGDKEARELVALVRAFGPEPRAKGDDEQFADFDARFRQLQEELDDLKKQFRELSSPPRKQ